MIVCGIVTLVLALLGAPLFTIIAANALFAYHYAEIQLSGVAIPFYGMATGNSSAMLVTIPLFTLAGCLLSASGAPSRLVKLSRALLGWVPGGLSIVALLACALFTAFTGATGVTIVALGGLLYPALREDQYGENFSLGLVTTGGSLGLLFPPSLPLILYVVVAKPVLDNSNMSVSIGDLFAAGVIPGVLMLLMLAGYGMAVGYRRQVASERVTWRDFGSALWAAKWEAPLPFVVLWVIYSGKVAISEAAAVTAVYVLLVEVIFLRDVSLRELPKVLRQTAVLVGGILIIMGVALSYTGYLIDEEVPQQILETIRTYISSKLLFLVLLNVFLLIVGCMMDIFSALFVVVPLILPIALEYGVDPVHLGIIFLTNLQIGYCTPPVGLNLFIASYRLEKPVVRLYISTLPFLAILLLALIIITYVPSLSLLLAGATEAANGLTP